MYYHSTSSSSTCHDTFLHYYSTTPPPVQYSDHQTPPAFFSDESCLFTSAPSSFSSPSYFHRSSSSVSLQKQTLEYNKQPELLESKPISIRRVFSTGDIQQPFRGHFTQEEGTRSVGKVGRYNPEERRERIERYRIKRNQRNFHKKITYVCRKTLADSRPRVRGRFARNGEAETEGDAREGNGYNDFQFTGGEFYPWRKNPAAVTEEEDEDLYGCEIYTELWSSFFDVCSMNNLIS